MALDDVCYVSRAAVAERLTSCKKDFATFVSTF